MQIAGADPQRLAEAARHNVAQGAQLIDINMGCPAKKVCNAESGSALMRDEALVARICQAVVGAVAVPVTLKIRTGWARAQRNGPVVARIAEDCGIAALAVHGRTREDLYAGAAEYDTIAAIKQAVCIPLWANGDIDTPEKAREVLHQTGADGLMIGRAAQGRPWIFREIAHFLATGDASRAPPPTIGEVPGPARGPSRRALRVSTAPRDRSCVPRASTYGWYVRALPGGEAFHARTWISIEECDAQKTRGGRLVLSPPLARAPPMGAATPAARTVPDRH